MILLFLSLFQFYYTQGLYSVCDYTEIAQPENWLRTDYIGFNRAKRIFISIKYAYIRKHFKERLQVFSAQANKFSSPHKPPNGFEKLSVVESTSNISDWDTTFLTGSIKAKRNGFYLAFLDQGQCIMLYHISIFYYYCKTISRDFVKFPKTISPAEESKGT